MSWYASSGPKRSCESLLFEQALQNPKLMALVNEWLDTKLDERFKEAEFNLNDRFERMEIAFDALIDKLDTKLNDRGEVVELLKEAKLTLEDRVQLLEAEINDRNTRLLGLSGANAFNKFVSNHNAELKDRIKQLEQLVRTATYAKPMDSSEARV